MEGEWRETVLGDVTENHDGRRIPVKESDRRPGPFPYYGASGIVDNIDDYLFDGDFLLIAEDGENLRTRKTPIAFLASGKFWVNNHAHIVQGNDLADTRFLMYALSTTDVSGYLTGSTMPKLTQGNLNRIPILVPSRREQTRIVGILGTLDDKIELNRKMSETLEGMARALFTSWFVNFDPVRAKAEGRDTGLPKEVANLFPDSFEDSELGEIPKGWGVGGLDSIATFRNGLALQKFPPVGADSLPVIKIAQLRAGHSIGADRASASLPSEYVVVPGDVLFSWSGSLECRIWTEGSGALNQHLFKVTSSAYPKWLYYLWIHHHLPDFRAIASGKATTMGHIQRHHLSEAKVVIPPVALMQALDGTLAPLVDANWLRNVESGTLARIRDSLLTPLLDGSLRISTQS